MNENFKPWDTEQAIFNMRTIRDYLAERLHKTDTDPEILKADLMELDYDFGAVEDALQKQKPKKPICDSARTGLYECPTCQVIFKPVTEFYKPHYCEDCGQALDWEAAE